MNSNKTGCISLSHFLSKSLFLGIGISRVISDAKESTIFSLLLGTLFGYVLLKFILKLNSLKLTKIQKIITVFLLFFLLIIGFTEIINLISSIYLIDTNKYLILLPLIVTILYLNTKKIEINYKISSIILFISFITFFIILLSLIPRIKVLNYLPLYKVKLYKIITTSFEFALYTVLPNIVFNYLNIVKENRLENKLLKNYIISNIFLIITILLVQGVLGVNLVNIFKFPEYIILKKIRLLDFINNVENIFSFLWIFTIYIYLSIVSKCLFDMFERTFNNKYIYPIVLFISMYFISNYFFDNIKYLLFLYNYLWIISLLLLTIYILTFFNALKKK